MARIFISYTRADRQFVDGLVPLLRRVYGHDSLWFDDDIHGGADWWQMILREIADCELFMYLISNDSLASPYCQAEMREARRLHKQILPVIVRPKTVYPDAVDDDLALVLQQTQYVDMARGIKDTNALALLYASMNRLLAQVPPHMPTPLSAQPTSQPPVPDHSPERPGRGVWVIGAVIAVLVIGALILVASGLLGGGDGGDGEETPNTQAVGFESSDTPTLAGTDTPEPTDTPQPTAAPTDTPTPSPTLTETPTPTLSATELEQTIEAEMNLALTENAQTALAHEAETAVALTATGQAAGLLATQEAADQTATATLWTPTPTPDLRATAHARLTETRVALIIRATENANATATQWFFDQTATATLWTATPTATFTPTETPSPTRTPTDTPTTTPTDTPTPTLTATFTPEPTSTPIPTPTPDPLQAAQTPVSRNDAWEPFVQTFDGVEMVLVPAGCFEMGNEDGRANEKPVHRVCFEEPFWIDRTEVTNGQFAAFNGQAPRSSYFSGEDRPREQITWTEAQAFCESRGARLPTETEWEYAARGPDGVVYPWGNTFDCHLGNFDDETVRDSYVVEGGAGCDGYDGTAPVGSFPDGRSWVGAVDMSGNVWEWVADWYGERYYASLEEGAVNPSGPASGESRVLRGGAWDVIHSVLFRASYRDWTPPLNWSFNWGFRCARSR